MGDSDSEDEFDDALPSVAKLDTEMLETFSTDVAKIVELRKEIRKGIIPNKRLYEMVHNVKGTGADDDITFDELLKTVRILYGYTASCHVAYPLNVMSHMNALLHLQEAGKVERDEIVAKVNDRSKNYTVYNFLCDYGGETLLTRLHFIKRHTIPDTPWPPSTFEQDAAELRQRVSQLAAKLEDSERQLKAKTEEAANLQEQLRVVAAASDFSATPELLSSSSSVHKKPPASSVSGEALDRIIRQLTALRKKSGEVKIVGAGTSGIEKKKQSIQGEQLLRMMELKRHPEKYADKTPEEIIAETPEEFRFIAFLTIETGKK